MKRKLAASGGRWVAVAALASGACGFVGCGKSEAPASAQSTASEVKGEPIRGEAIQAPPPAVAGGASRTGAVDQAAAVGTGTAASVTAANGVPAAAGGAGAGAAAGTGTAAAPLTVGFDKLASFQYTLPDGPVDTNTVVKVAASAQIPVTIQALNNQFVSLKGFMLPLKVEKGLVTELLIMRDQSMCCYGTVPRINEWVSVKMVGGGVKPVMDQAVTLFGKLKVGEMYENGYLVGIYAMDGERMAGPLDM